MFKLRKYVLALSIGDNIYWKFAGSGEQIEEWRGGAEVVILPLYRQYIQGLTLGIDFALHTPPRCCNQRIIVRLCSISEYVAILGLSYGSAVLLVQRMVPS